MSPWQHRTDANFPYQRWQPFPDEAIVEVANVHGGEVYRPSARFLVGIRAAQPREPAAWTTR